jgi:aldehyde:ferredoxin oxidoreductase
VKNFLGGRGINQWILYKETKPWVTPYEPANRLIFGTSPLVGTLASGACRLNVDAKSPFTGGIGSSNSGGHFAPELRFAGWDHMVIEGKAQKPVYIWINNGRVEIKGALHIWGRTTWETDDMIKEDLGDPSVQTACIGPAGENLVRTACIIINRSRAAGRCGLGAVMGSKNLKAIAVKGTGSLEPSDPEGFMDAVEESWERLKKSMGAKLLEKYGTTLVSPLNNFSLMPMRNFQDGHMHPSKLEKISEENFVKYQEGSLSCFGCPLHCGHFYRIKQGPYAGEACEGLEGNSISDFGCRFDIDYAPAILKAHSICNQYGLDIDNASCAIAWAFELYQRGILTKKDTDGYKLEWCNHEIVIELLKKMTHREGIGDILAEGCKKGLKVGRQGL